MNIDCLPCYKCKPKPPASGLPVTPTPSGWYCIIFQTTSTALSHASAPMATVYVGFGGETSGTFITDPAVLGPLGYTVIYIVHERNIKYDSNPYYAGYGIGEFVYASDALDAANQTLANAL